MELLPITSHIVKSGDSITVYETGLKGGKYSKGVQLIQLQIRKDIRGVIYLVGEIFTHTMEDNQSLTIMNDSKGNPLLDISVRLFRPSIEVYLRSNVRSIHSILEKSTT